MAEVGIEIGEKPSGGCACGEHDAVGFPELNVQLIPHEIRHATIFGALAGVAEGRGLIINATHDPVPLLMQAEQRFPGMFAVDYLERGPEIFRVQFARN